MISPILEALEKRLAPAGLIHAILSGGVLRLTGDAEANDLTITQAAPGSLHLEGGNGTTISLNGAAPVATLDIANAGKGLIADLKAGDDHLSLQNISFTGDVNVQLGADNNGFDMVYTTNIGGNLTVSGLGGRDDIATTEDVVIAGKTIFNLGGGINQVNLSSSNLTFGKGLSFSGGSGESHFTIEAQNLTAGGDFNYSVGGSDNFIIRAERAVNIKGNFNYTGLTNPDGNHLSIEAGSLLVGGSVNVRTGNGYALIGLSGRDLIQVGGNLNITHGDGGIGSSANTVSSNGSIILGGSLGISNGNGSWTNNLSGSFHVGGNFSLTNGNTVGYSNTTSVLNLKNSDIRGSLILRDGTGLYDEQIFADRLHTGAGVIISHQTSQADPDLGTYTTLTLVIQDLSTTNISISNGNGAFETEISCANAHLSGSLSLRNGNVGPREVTGTGITGSYEMAGGLSLINGTGAFQTTLSGSFQIGTNVSITQGNSSPIDRTQLAFEGEFCIKNSLTIRNGSGSYINTFSTYNLTIGRDLTLIQGNAPTDQNGPNNGTNVTTFFTAGNFVVDGDFTIRNGNGEFFNNLLTSEGYASSYTIGGALTMSNGRHPEVGGSAGHHLNQIQASYLSVGGPVNFISISGSTSTVFTVGEANLHSHVVVTNGAGYDEFIIDASSFNLHGSLIIRDGAGSSSTQIYSNSGLAIDGNVSVSALSGIDSLDIVGPGRIGGSVNASFGLGESAEVVLGGSNGTGQSLLVGGPIRLTAGIGTDRALAIDNVRLATGLSLTGGSGSDRVSISNSTIGGGLNLNLLNGSNVVTLDSTAVNGAFTLLTGTGEDLLMIGANPAIRVSAVQFYGPVTVRMGADMDSLVIGGSGSATPAAVFQGPVLLDGGADVNNLTATLDPSATGSAPRFLAGPPTVLNFTLYPGPN